MMAREPGIVGTWAHRKAGLAGEQDVVALALQRLPDELLRATVRVDVGGIDQVDAGVDGDGDLALGGVEVTGAYVGELAGASDAHGAERHLRDPQS
jgi:hypothetical protein